MKRAIIMLLATIVLLQLSCKKADRYAQLVNASPFITVTGMSLSSVGINSYNGYQTTFYGGDPATFVGRVCVNKPGFKIQVGNDTAQLIVYKQKILSQDT